MRKREDFEKELKATEEVEDVSRIDALARALGFEFSEGEYVKRRKDRRGRPRLAKRVPGVTTRTGARNKLKKDVYDSLSSLRAGDRLDVTDAMRTQRISIKQMQTRMYTLAYRIRKEQLRNVVLSVRTDGGRIYVEAY